ncbi:hypothetical protein [Anaeromyxobacter sp. SG17]|uniref:hypothetical protein n=1 Tax=Anaeromyxobacter sp. SG17 TaxID=2925405 RepID=UPI001F5A5340|nr:hypothetical protein [Anaeromyxobacter sp. SG17]
MRRLASFPALLAAVLGLAGCDVFERLQNDRVLAGVLIESPGVSQPDQNVNLAGTVAATVFFGEVDKGANPADAASWRTTGLDGATVRLTWDGGTATLAPAGAAGQYALTGGALAYVPGTAYTFRVEYGGETYSGTVTAPPRPVLQDESGAPLPVVQAPIAYSQLPDPYVLRRDGTSVAFYAVTALSSPSGAVNASAATCTNAPDVTDPMAVVRLFLDDGAWRTPTFSLAKADCFPAPAPQYGYGLLLTSVNKVGGTSLSSNLFLGSGVVAGSAAASVLPVH